MEKSNKLVSENEQREPKLVELRTIALSKNEPDEKRGMAALCYYMIALAFDRDRTKED